MQEYKEHKKPKVGDEVFDKMMDTKVDVEFSAEILTSGHWPNQESGNVKIPA